MVYDKSEIERRLDAGAWLKPGEIGALLDRPTPTVKDWFRDGKIRYRTTLGGHREANPEDVAKLLSEHRQQHGGPAGS